MPDARRGSASPSQTGRAASPRRPEARLSPAGGAGSWAGQRAFLGAPRGLGAAAPIPKRAMTTIAANLVLARMLGPSVRQTRVVRVCLARARVFRSGRMACTQKQTGASANADASMELLLRRER